MAFDKGSKLGPYEIVGRLGAGGMGEVYRARDPRLDREVALKILPESLTGDAVSRARFEREAKAVAALSHPNILAIYEFGEEEGKVYAAMELLEGETLRQRLEGRSLPVSKAVEVALAAARGLAAAHDRDIVHRDLKPENVFLTADGQVKLLDFGLAKAGPGAGTDTSTAIASQAGALFGTIEYMSPEQLRAEETDGRSDVFALGVVLYEMLAGERPFHRDTLADTMSSILNQDPPPITRQPVPEPLVGIVEHCLEKRPEERFQSAHDLAFALSAVTPSTGSLAGVPRPRTLPRRSRRRWWLAASGAAALAAAFGLGWWLAKPVAPVPAAAPLRASFEQLTSLPGVETAPTLGLEGRAFVYAGDAGGDFDLYIQRVGGSAAINLTPDSPADDTAPAFSPDGELVAFRSERLGGGIFVMGATGESVRRVSEFGFDPAWSPDGRWLVVATEAVDEPLSRATVSKLWAVRILDGERRLVSEGDAVQPAWSPDGEWIAYWASGPDTGQRDLYTVAAGGGEPVAVTADPWVDWNPVWSPDGGHLYFSSDRSGTMNLWRVAIDPATGGPLGEPEPVTTPAGWSGYLSVGAGGRVAYVAREQRSTLYRVDFDPNAEATGTPEPVLRGSRVVDDVDLSPDGTRIAFTSGGSREDLFLLAADGSGLRQLTDDPARDRGPQWSPDGRRIAFYSNRSESYEVWSLRPDGSGLEQLSETAGSALWFPVWAPSGSRFAASNADQVTVFDLNVQLASRAVDRLPDWRGGGSFIATSWSPDGRTLAGCRLESGAPAEGITLYSLDDRSYRSVLDDGFHPVWLADSRRLLVWRQRGLWLLDTATGRLAELLPAALGPLAWRDFAVSRDNRTIVFSQMTVESDIWLMTLE